METKGEFERPARPADRKEREEIFSRYVNAGRRRYFFDVKATRADDYYLVITESTRRYNDDGTERYERHRLFLYKEDFDKFSDRLAEVTDFIKRERGETPIRYAPEAEKQAQPSSIPNVREEPTLDTPEKSAIGGPASGGEVKDTDAAVESSEFTDVKFEDLGDASEEKEETSEAKEEGDASSGPSSETKANGEDSSPEVDQPSAEAAAEEEKEEEETKKAEKE